MRHDAVLQEDGTREKVHCLLPVMHAPLDPAAEPSLHAPAGVRDAYISSDGCLFPCKCGPAW